MCKFIKLKIKNIYKNNVNKSIQHIISIYFTIIAIIGMIIVGISFNIKFINSTEDMISHNNAAILEQVNLNLDSYLRKMMKISDTIYYKGIKNKDFSVDNINREMELLYEENKDSLISICLFSEYGEVISSYPLGQLKEKIDPRKNDWFFNAIKKKENLHFSTPHVQNLFVDPNNKYRWVVSLSRSVEVTNNGRVIPGVLLVDMNFSGIEQICKNVDIGKNGYVYLINKDGEIVYHPRQQLIYSDLIEENNIMASTYEDGSKIEKFNGEKRLVTVKTVGYTGWKLVGITPMVDIISGQSHIMIFTIFIIAFAIFILTSVNVFVSSRITNPIRLLEKSVKKLEAGTMDADIYISGTYEIQSLGRTIKSMANEMQVLMDNIKWEHEEKRKSELNALQAQINPHFLYNTLDSIIWMIENEKYEGSIIMVTALARFFRISISKGKNIITVSDELDHARNYLTIQKIRYKNRFDYDIEAKEEVLNMKTIKLIIQPLIENAIYHGMEYMSDDGDILIKAYIKEDKLNIDVIDNGLGMLPEVAESLLTDETLGNKKGSGIGIKNVHERIQLCFGKEYGVTIFSEPDEGTTINIKMPCIKD